MKECLTETSTPRDRFGSPNEREGADASPGPAIFLKFGNRGRAGYLAVTARSDLENGAIGTHGISEREFYRRFDIET